VVVLQTSRTVLIRRLHVQEKGLHALRR